MNISSVSVPKQGSFIQENSANQNVIKSSSSAPPPSTGGAEKSERFSTRLANFFREDVVKVLKNIGLGLALTVIGAGVVAGAVSGAVGALAGGIIGTIVSGVSHLVFGAKTYDGGSKQTLGDALRTGGEAWATKVGIVCFGAVAGIPVLIGLGILSDAHPKAYEALNNIKM